MMRRLASHASPSGYVPWLTVLGATLLLSGCGVADTAVTAAAGGAAEAQQARQARAMEERVKQQVDAAVQADAEHRRAAEAASE